MNTLFDTTVVAVSIPGLAPQLDQVGRYSFGLIVAALLLLAVGTPVQLPGFGGSLRAWCKPSWEAVTNNTVIAFCATALAGTAIYLSMSNDVLSYDPIRYYLMSELVAATLQMGSFLTVLGDAIATNADDYSLWPAVAPGALTQLFGGLSLASYTLSMVVIYLIPAAFACSALGYALVQPHLPEGGHAMGERSNLAALGSVAALMLVPAFLAVFLWPFPDIGGVAFSCAFIACVSKLCVTLVDPQRPTNSWRSILGLTVLVVLLAVCLFLFRRWYVFITIGVTCAALLWVALAWHRHNFAIPGILSGMALVFSAGVLTFLALLADVIVDWLAAPAQRNYYVLYSSYWSSYADVTNDFIEAFGILVPLFSIAFCIFLVARTRRALPFILLVGSLVAFLMFLTIKSPGRQHYYLLMPLFSGTAAAGAIWLARLWGARAACMSTLAVSLLVIGFIPLPKSALSVALPAPGLLTPPNDSDIPVFAKLVDWLVTNVGPGERYCVAASSNTFNATISQKLWLRAPELRKKMPDSIWMGEVNSRDGPPPREMRDCNAMLVADPVQIQLRPTEQNVVTLVAEAVLQGRGIGSAFQRAGPVFQLRNGVKVVPFKRIRPVEDAEYQSLREEFFNSKGDEAAQYRARF